MRNAYKQLHIFKCVHEAHRGFESRMSVHHILNRKGCYPNGCFYFKWHCKLFKQGKPCYRGYKKMKKTCMGCRHFYEEKIHNHPTLQVSEEQYQDFVRELREFEDWLGEHRHKEWDIEGRLDGVKPLFQKHIYGKGEGISFSGFLLLFRTLFIGNTLIEDPVYIRVSTKTYRDLQLGAGDKIIARATLDLDQGRLVMTRLRRIEIPERGEAPFWDESRALVARETATQMPIQPEGCHQCPFGTLVDVEDKRERETRRFRQLYCLRGMPDFRACDIYPGYAGEAEMKQSKPSNSASCMTYKVRVMKP